VLESALVGIVERRGALGIYVKNSEQISARPEHWYHDLRFRTRITGDMSGKLPNIVDNDSFPLGGSGSANAPAKGDVNASETALIRADAKQLTGLDDTVKARPKISERVMNESRDSRHRGHVIVDSM
jgi:hypothetical protein